MRYYYKKENSYLSLKSPLTDKSFTEITEEEFNNANKAPEITPEHLAMQKNIMEINEYKAKLAALDYIGVKIATGRATREEYSEQIALMQQYADKINELQEELQQ